MSHAPVTLKHIAAKAGVHFSTVSLALRNHPSIPESTRARLQALAKRMNYRPDPMLSALGAYRARHARPTRRGVLAWLDASPDARSMREIFGGLWAGARSRAKELGWDLQEFRLAELGLSPRKFSDMLRARGIEGVLVAPMPGDGGSLELEWSWFSAIAVGHTLLSPRLHRVAPHQVHNVQLLMQIVRGLGYQRPGLVISPQLHERTRHYWMAGFLAAQQELPAAARLPPLVREFETPGAFARWLERHRPDVIVSGKLDRTMEMLAGAGLRVPDDVGVAGTGIDYPAAGIDEGFDTIGTVAIDSLVALIHRHERGVPRTPMHIQLEGRWKPAPTVRRIEAAKTPASRALSAR